MEAIVLAGGLGTRLRSEVDDVPKPMAPIQGQPFLNYLLDHLISQGVTQVIFSVGHKSDIIEDYFHNKYKGCSIIYAREEKRLGTGGAILHAMSFCKEKHVIVVNGDSLFLNDLQKQMALHINEGVSATLALKPMSYIERYGTVEIDDSGRIHQFNEKQPLEHGLINTGNYIFDVESVQQQILPEVFSIEKEFFETHLENLRFQGFVSEGYFLDIGIPEDFRKAQYEIGVFPKIDRSWTLFLDRDGVINVKRINDYVKCVEEFQFLPGATEAIAKLRSYFGRIVIVTNQQGVGKGLMSEEALDEVHAHLQRHVEAKGGSIDAILHAPQLVNQNSPFRKPKIGMAQRAQEMFPDIDFSKSLMIGDSSSDMEFANTAGMYQVFIGDGDYDYCSESLQAVTQILQEILG